MKEHFLFRGRILFVIIIQINISGYDRKLNSTKHSWQLKKT